MYLRVIFYSHQYVQDSEFQIEIDNYICTYTKYYLNHYDPIFENIICLKIQYDVSYEPNVCITMTVNDQCSKKIILRGKFDLSFG